ncbi:hypothetical protein [Chromatium okenii]|nr:hypothetical protein [Chromatium okenii]
MPPRNTQALTQITLAFTQFGHGYDQLIERFGNGLRNGKQNDT